MSVTSKHGPTEITWATRSGNGRIDSAPLSPVYNLLNSGSHAVAVVPLEGTVDWQEVVVASVHNDTSEAGEVEFSVSISHFPKQNQEKLTFSISPVDPGTSATLHLVLHLLD